MVAQMIDIDNPPYISFENLNQEMLTKNNNTTNHLSFLHINTRSLIKNIDNLHKLICKLPSEPDVIFVTETKLNSTSNIDLAQLNNYTLSYKNAFSKAGGVGFYIKKNIDFNIRQDVSLHNKDVESLWAKITLTKTQSINIGVVYRHPTGNIYEFSDQIKDILIKLNSEKHKSYIMGDFNINTIEKPIKSSTNTFSLMIKSTNFHNVIKTPTRITKTSATCIDHFYTNHKESIIRKFILIDNTSDHLPLLGIINCKHKINQTKPIYKRISSNLNLIKLRENTETKMKHLFNQYLQNPTQCIHYEFQLLTENLQEIINESIPLVKLSNKKTRLKQKPWLTKGLLKSSKVKNKMYKKLIKLKFNETLSNKYKKFRNKLTHLINLSKKLYYEKLLKNSCNDSKKTWNIINSVIGKTNKKTSLPVKLNKDGIEYTEPQLIANILNKHFAEIGKNSNKKIDYKKIDSYLTNAPQKHSMVLYPTDVAEISLIIKEMKNQNSEGADQIPMNILKKINPIISPIINYLINKSINLGIYPNCLKVAKIIPLFKAGNASDPGNHRPISILPAINKIFERIIYKRILNFCHKYKIINSTQFGFRQGHSTELAISKFYEDILNNFNNNNASFALFLDLSKAFDSVHRDILVHKLYKYGIRGIPLNLIKSYLTDRKQFIKIDNITSESHSSTIGVPQGSILSPLLFLILINDFKNSTTMETINFADDTLVYCTIKDPNNIENTLNNEFQKIINWMDANHLKLNYNKTNFLIFSPKTNKFKPLEKIKLLGKTENKIERKAQCKYLGLIIDEQLNWKNHLTQLQTKLAKAVGTLYRVRPYLNKPSLIKLLHSIIISRIRYGILCYGRSNKTNLKPISILFNQSIRCINYLKRTDKSIQKLYSDAKLLNLENMFKLELGKFCFKAKKNTLPKPFRNLFTDITKIHTHKTRNFKNRLYLRKQNKKKGLLTLEHMGAKFWNQIPNTIKNKNNVKNFARNLSKFLINQ